MKLSSYTILILFVILILTGSVLVFRLSFQLEPSVSLPSVTVSYSWPNMPGRVVEQEVTSVLESGFSRMKGIEELTSTSSGGRGTIRIAFDKTVSFDAARFEVSSIIRQLYPKLPDQVSYPRATNCMVTGWSPAPAKVPAPTSRWSCAVSTCSRRAVC
jgi:multidrug efflux pump subunit AcrB